MTDEELDIETAAVGDRFLELVTAHAARGGPELLRAAGFDPNDPTERALSLAAAVTADMLAFACSHGRLTHGCGATAPMVVRAWVMSRQARLLAAEQEGGGS